MYVYVCFLSVKQKKEPWTPCVSMTPTRYQDRNTRRVKILLVYDSIIDGYNLIVNHFLLYIFIFYIRLSAMLRYDIIVADKKNYTFSYVRIQGGYYGISDTGEFFQKF